MHAKQGEARSKESSQELPPLHTSIDVKDVLSRQAPIQKLQTKRTQHKNSNKPSKRDAMGRYIPPPGQKPLTSLDLPTPGPQYDPQILQPFPEYSIQGKTDITRNKNIGPGPAANYTASKTHGGFSFADYEVPAPNNYNVSKNIKSSRSFSLSGWSKTFGEVTPSPSQYASQLNANTNPKWSLGTRRPITTIGGSIVGPGDYSPDYHLSTRAISISKRLPDSSFMQVNPAPNIYNPKLETTNVGASLKGWNKEEFKGSKNPGPSNYILPPGLFTGPQFTLGPKQVVSEQVIKHPGPAEYDINLQSVATSQPKYSLGKRISDGSRTNFPAPNSYSTTDRQISHNDAPKYSLKSRHRLSNKHQNPGPADYEPIKPIMDLKKTIKNEVKREVVSSVVSKVIAPGPSDYTAVPSKNHAPAYSIGKRLESSKLHETPSANAYSPEDINKVHGISLKSRGSPFVVVFSSNRVDTLRSSV